MHAESNLALNQYITFGIYRIRIFGVRIPSIVEVAQIAV